jgi:SNF2 family DNA or RNA helicase
MKYVPKEYQGVITDHIISTPRCNVWASMGSGKSAAVLSALVKLNTWPVLVVAPLRVAKTTWPDEVSKWDEFKHLKVVPILGTASERYDARHRQAHIYTINYENIPWLVEQYLGKWPYKVVVADESTKLKGLRLRGGSKRAHELARVAFLSPRFINLTGTPSPNGIEDLWGQSWFLDRGARLGKSFTAFSDRWFKQHYSGFGIIPHNHSQSEVEEKLKDITISVNAKDYFDIKEPIVRKVFVTLPENVQKMYRRMQNEMFMQLKKEDVTAFNAAARTQKLLQLTSGAAYIGENAEKYEEVHDEKLKALESVIEEAAGMPVLVAYNFRSDLERLRKYFPKGRVLDANPRTIKDWNEGRVQLLFAHPASAGHGISLQHGGNIIVFAQIIERIGPTRQAQSGYDRPVFVYHIVASGTIDETVLERLSSKREIQDLLLEKMKVTVGTGEHVREDDNG